MGEQVKKKKKKRICLSDSRDRARPSPPAHARRGPVARSAEPRCPYLPKWGTGRYGGLPWLGLRWAGVERRRGPGVGRRRSAVAQGRGVLGEARLAAPKSAPRRGKTGQTSAGNSLGAGGQSAGPSGPVSGKSPAQIPQVAPGVTRGLISSHFPTPIPTET